MNRVLLIGFIASVPLLFSTQLSAAEWKLVVDAGYLVYDLDHASVSREKSVVTFWSKTTVREGDTYFPKYSPNEIPYVEQKIHNRIDCSKRTHAFLAAVKFNDSGRALSSTYAALPESAIVPDSVADYYFKAVCLDPQKSTKPSIKNTKKDRPV